MKKMMLTLTLATISSLNIYANTQALCGQADLSFKELAQKYRTCNDLVSSSQESCDNFCYDASKLLGSSNQGGSCSADEITRIQQDARSQGIKQGVQMGRDEVLRDLSVKEDYVSRDYYGINEADCASRASQASQNLRLDAINRCNSKAISIKNCYVQSEKVVGAFSQAPKFTENGYFKRDDNRSSEQECRDFALSDATKKALSQCNEVTGTSCSINETLTIINHKVEKVSGPRFGRRDQRICDARVTAEASPDLGYKCNIRISARNQAFAN